MIGFAKKTEVKVHKIRKLGRDRNASALTFQPFGGLKLSIFRLFYTIRNRYALTTLYLKFLLAFFPSREFLSHGKATGLSAISNFAGWPSCDVTMAGELGLVERQSFP